LFEIAKKSNSVVGAVTLSTYQNFVVDKTPFVVAPHCAGAIPAAGTANTASTAGTAGTAGTACTARARQERRAARISKSAHDTKKQQFKKKAASPSSCVAVWL